MARHDFRLLGTAFEKVSLPQGQAFSCSWDRFVERFKNPRCLIWGNPSNEEIDKRKKAELKLWTPATFVDCYHSDSKFINNSALVFDVDYNADLQAIRAALASFAGIVHTSIKHTSESPRCRVVLPLSRPVTATEYKRLWLEIAPTVGEVDQKAKDPGRLWFQPACIKGRPYEAFELGNGLIQVDQTLALLPSIDPPRFEQEPPSRLSRHEVQSAAYRASKWLEKADPAISGSGGQAALWHVACGLVVGFSLDPSQALTLLGNWNAQCKPPWSKNELARAVERAANGSTRPFGYLLEGGNR